MNILKLIVILCPMAFFISVTACKRDNCFDRSLYNEYKDRHCTMDCPGVIGCDGKFYCNECEANKQGIHVQR